MKYYKIENWFLFDIELDEKKSKEYMKKYFYYNRNGIIIFNFDYNKIKPIVISILEKKWYIKNLAKILTISLIWVIFFFLILFWLFNNSINKKLDLITKNINNEKQTKNKIIVSNPIGSNSIVWSWNILNWTGEIKKHK